tara:strand:- start:459 stop:593 length:135 start_codon:yes stop_codon:yes gene_type:complete
MLSVSEVIFGLVLENCKVAFDDLQILFGAGIVKFGVIDIRRILR